MSDDPRKPNAFLVTTSASGTYDDKGDPEIKEIHVEAEPVYVECAEEPGEVLYEDKGSAGKVSLGYSRAYSANWESSFGQKESLPN